MDNIVKFNIDIIDKYKNDESQDFSIIQIQALSDGYNTHELIIPSDVLKRDAKTVLGKPIVAKLSKDFYGNEDFKGHETDEVVIGYVPPNAEIRFPQEENGTFFEVDAVIFKLYSGNTLEIFKRDGIKSVSCEFSYNYEDEDHQNNISELNIRGITILGSDDFGNKINPSCTGANAKIVRFSETDAENAYEQFKAIDKKESLSIDTILEKLNSIDKKIEDINKQKTLNLEEKNKEEQMAKIKEKEEEKKISEPKDKTEEAKAQETQKEDDEAEKMAKTDDEAKEDDKEKADTDSKEKEDEKKMSQEDEEKTKKTESKMAELEAKLAEKEETIKAQLSEIESLKEYKNKVELSQKENVIAETLAQVHDYVDETKLAEIKESAKNCSFADINGWKNEVLASITEKVLMSANKHEDGVMDMGLPVVEEKMDSIYDYVK